MSRQEDEQGSDWIDEIVGAISFLSLAGSLAGAWPLITSIGPGFYGGTQFLLVLGLIGQGGVLFLGVIMPLVIRVIRRKPMPSRGVCILAAMALFAVLLEAAAVLSIPVTGKC